MSKNVKKPTSYYDTHEDADTPSLRSPSTLSNRLARAKGPKSLAMGEWGDMVTDETDEHLGVVDPETREGNELRERILAALKVKSPDLSEEWTCNYPEAEDKNEREGERKRRANETEAELQEREYERLAQLQEDLNAIPLSDDIKRQKVQIRIFKRLTEAINARQEDILVEKAQKKVASLLDQLSQVIDLRRLALNDKKWPAVDAHNRQTVIIAKALLAELDLLRRNNPDKLVEITRETHDSNFLEGYEKLVTKFVQTHNSFHFSEDILDSLRLHAKYQKNGEFGFAKGLLQAYGKRPKRDQSYQFIREVTEIPPDKLARIIPLNSNL